MPRTPRTSTPKPPLAEPDRLPVRTGTVWTDVSLLTADDLFLFNEGTHYNLWDKFGSHPIVVDDVAGTYFAVWAPNAREVSVIGDFNGWNPSTHFLQPKGSSGIWEGFIPGVGVGTHYKYHLVSQHSDFQADKADPFAFFAEVAPANASIVWDLAYDWQDANWLRERWRANVLDAPISVYEVHLGSWRRVPEEGARSLSYREIAPQLLDHVRSTGFTHVELLPIMEHPFFGSWGYQTTGYFAPTSRFGTPQDFMALIDLLHQNGIGVYLDWVPSHFPNDPFGPAFFDGTHLYEHADPRQGFHPDWKSMIFNYGRNEVRSFLISSALFWLKVYHADGLRVDAVASMLYRDYSRKDGEWVPNAHGGRENLEAIDLLRTLNTVVYQNFPDIQTIAEESTAWPMVSRPTYVGGLGFGMKWDMGWMHDTLAYFEQDPVHRKYHQNLLTFRAVYGWSENFVLPLSHDEVVHGKGSLLSKMPGDVWQKFANLRALFGYMYATPGKKLLFMGGEFGQWREWNHESSLDWHLLGEAAHGAIQQWVGDLNRVYRSEPALYTQDVSGQGFAWVDCCDTEQSVISFLRIGTNPEDVILVVGNFTPVPRQNYRLGAPRSGFWPEILNSDAPLYGGSGWGNLGGVETVPVPLHGFPYSVTLTLPPLSVIFLKHQRPGG